MKCVCVCVVSAEDREVFFSSAARERFQGVQQTEGSSTAAAPSVTALTHLAIVWEALLTESEHGEGRLFYVFRL